MRALTMLGVVLVMTATAIAQPAKRKPPVLAADIAALAGTDIELAVRAADTLGTRDAPAAHTALLDALALGLPPRVASHAVAAVAAHPAPDDVVVLAPYARHRNPSVRGATLAALARYTDSTARDLIAGGLADAITAVRLAAARAAVQGRVGKAVQPLVQLLARGDEVAARALADLADLADLLIVRKLADPSSRLTEPQIALCFGMILARADVTDATRVEVVRALGKLADPAALAALTAYASATPRLPKRASREEAQQIVDARAGAGK